MKLETEIKKPSHQSEPDYITGKKDELESFEFECTNCGTDIEIDFQRQIKYNWNGNTDLISESERTELKKYYGIGLSEKSHDGGYPVFDKIICKTCGVEYLTYCGVREFSNSAYSIHVQGIQKIK
tara:strand:+ start:293 stop:667 length:375 start_codon:yes stop_codon:yes gene_type:complete